MAGGGARRGTLVIHYGTDHRRPLLDRGSPETEQGPAVASPRIRDAMGQGARTRHDRPYKEPTEGPMPQANDMSRCLVTLEQDNTLIAVIELSQASWLVAGIVPAIERQPVKKIEADEVALLRLLE